MSSTLLLSQATIQLLLFTLLIEILAMTILLLAESGEWQRILIQIEVLRFKVKWLLIRKEPNHRTRRHTPKNPS